MWHSGHPLVRAGFSGSFCERSGVESDESEDWCRSAVDLWRHVCKIFLFIWDYGWFCIKNNHVEKMVRMLIVNLFASIEGINYISIINKNYNRNIKIDGRNYSLDSLVGINTLRLIHLFEQWASNDSFRQDRWGCVRDGEGATVSTHNRVLFPCLLLGTLSLVPCQKFFPVYIRKAIETCVTTPGRSRCFSSGNRPEHKHYQPVESLKWHESRIKRPANPDGSLVTLPNHDSSRLKGSR